MSNIDKQALRETAEKATSGKWERGDGNGNGGELLVYCDDALGSAVCEMTSEHNAIPKYQRINNLNFIAAANPATVLALLNELEAVEKRIDEQREIMRQAASDISYAIFNLTGSDLSRLNPGVVETTDPTDTALIAERNLRAAAAGKGEAS
ncbi:ead/Ea22-like family protein [Enterobacter hormaechei]|uniref:ead/Ea22-like family protein n=1 Tax=Enterobacter hormaechei TaxID=158836 RepID=UPI000E2E8237|nr:ead/Ea22-like family protein [Enterobacter hormaechei]EHF4994356.1 ead/Ea22-like family protein [Enterobacter hormaechei]